MTHPIQHAVLGAAFLPLLLLGACGQEAATVEDTPPAAAPDATSPADETLTGEAQQTPPASREDCGPVTSEGYCGVTFGMSPQEAMETFPGGLHAATQDNDPIEEGGCYYLNLAPDTYNIGFMVFDGEIRRLDLREPGYETAEGAGIGTTLEELDALYPDAERQPNKYTDLPNVVVTSGERGYIFETGEDGTVTRYRAGLMPELGWVEGCL